MDLNLLVASADDSLHELVGAIAKRHDVRVVQAAGGSEALAWLKNETIDVLILDHPVSDCDSTRLLKEARRRVPALAALAVVETGEAEDRDRLLRAGVDEIVDRPIRDRALERRIEALLQQAKDDRIFNILGSSSGIHELRNMIRLIGPTAATVLVTGESGVGKELVARALHTVSARREEVFVAVHAAALASSVLESELFGHERGAFTGADRQREGKFEAASTGTLFLDEIGEIDLNTQVKLLRVLEDQRFSRVGGNAEITTNCRVIAATNKDLAKEVDAGSFRRDLYYRLKIIEIHVPPLRDRGADIPLLWEHFCADAAERNRVRYLGTDTDTLRLLGQYEWPGNVRELRNAAERAVLVARGTLISPQTLPTELLGATVGSSPNLPTHISRTREDMEREAIYQSLVALRAEISEIKTLLLQMQSTSPPASGAPFAADPLHMRRKAEPVLVPDEDNYSSLGEMEEQMIERALFDFDGNRKRAARALGISERTLYRKLKEMGRQD